MLNTWIQNSLERPCIKKIGKIVNKEIQLFESKDIMFNLIEMWHEDQ